MTVQCQSIYIFLDFDMTLSQEMQQMEQTKHNMLLCECAFNAKLIGC